MPFKILSIHAFVMTDKDGVEGIPAFGAPGGMVMPMISADESRFLSLMPMAQQIANETGQTLTVLRFTRREWVEEIKPSKGAN